MKAVIMAGGEGTRLRPLTSNTPKPMLPVANRPMMEHVVNLLRQHGFDDIVVTVAFLPHAIKTYFADGSEFGVRITYADEPVPMGTAGSVGNARERLDERFLVISGDVLTDIDLTEIWASHERHGASYHRPHPGPEPARVRCRDHCEDGSIERFHEKPT
ncbi:MAG: nucleotidyltransferase family protein [Ilumatobacteraceae bacterium]